MPDSPDQQTQTHDAEPSLLELYNMPDAEAISYPFDLLVGKTATRPFWRSAVYKHYIVGLVNKPELDPVTGVCLVYTFKCRYGSETCKTRTRRRTHTGVIGTTTLKTASERCDKDRGVPSESEPNTQINFSNNHFRGILVLLCAVNHRPFHMVSDPLFIDLVQYLRPNTRVPCPQTVSSDLTRVFNRISVNVQEAFRENTNAMHLAIDGWSSPLKVAFLGIVVFWRQHGKLWRSVLDFIHITEKHTGAYMAQETIKCLDRLGVRNQITSICLDNARNNDTFVRSITPSLPNFEGPNSRSRCIAHIANLVAKAFLDLYSRPSASSRKRRNVADLAPLANSYTPSQANSARLPAPTLSGLEDHDLDPEVVVDETDGVLEIAPDVDEGQEHFDQDEVKGAVSKALERMRLDYGVVVTPAELREARDILVKVNGSAHAILTSSTLEPEFVRISDACKRAGSVTTKKEFPSAHVVTRWGSQLDTGNTHIDFQPAIEMMTANTRLGLTKHQLTVIQWDILKEVCACLEVLHEPTVIFSQKETLLIHEALPSMYLLRLRLTNMRDDKEACLRPVTRVAAYSALSVVEKYIRLMEESNLYLRATALCPWYKLRWFTHNGFSLERVKEVSSSLYHCFEGVQARRSSALTRVPESESDEPTYLIYPPKSKNRWMIDPEPLSDHPVPGMPPSPDTRGAIDMFLASPLVTKDKKVPDGGLWNYWTREHNQGSLIADIALDLLTASASSVDAERAFSGGRMAVNYRQHRMKLSTFRAKMAIGSWYGTPLLQGIDDVVYVLDDGAGNTSEPPDI